MTQVVYRAEVPTRIDGIPCRVGVTHYFSQPALGSWADSPADCYGFTECEFDVLDQRGRPAAWLQRKLSEKDAARISDEVREYIETDDRY